MIKLHCLNLILFFSPLFCFCQQYVPRFHANNKAAEEKVNKLNQDIARYSDIELDKERYAASVRSKADSITYRLAYIRDNLQKISSALGLTTKQKANFETQLSKINEDAIKTAQDTVFNPDRKNQNYLLNSDQKKLIQDRKLRLANLLKDKEKFVTDISNAKQQIDNLQKSESNVSAELHRHQIDSVSLSASANAAEEMAWQTSKQKDSLISLRDSVQNTSEVPARVVFYGSTAISSQTDEALGKSITASGQLLMSARIWDSVSIQLGANLINVNPDKTKKDSVNFNSLMFPETGNFGFLGQVLYRYAKFSNKEFSIIPYYEFAYRRVSIDSPQIGFKIYNHTLGVGFQWSPDFGTDDLFSINASVYGHLFKVPAEDVKNFTTFVNDSLFSKAAQANSGASIKSIGLKITVQYNSIVFFADFRKNLKTTQYSDSDPLKGSLVNIGFQTLLKIYSLPKKTKS